MSFEEYKNLWVFVETEENEVKPVGYELLNPGRELADKMGENCKYNGKNNKNSAAIHFLKDKEVISICPEVLAGMETPRPCAEIVNGRVVDENGNDVSLEYNKAVAVALSKIQNEEIDLVILQSRSPTCGVNQIYDGSFTGKLVSGMGLFAKALKQKGYHVIDVEEI